MYCQTIGGERNLMERTYGCSCTCSQLPCTVHNTEKFQVMLSSCTSTIQRSLRSEQRSYDRLADIDRRACECSRNTRDLKRERPLPEVKSEDVETTARGDQNGKKHLTTEKKGGVKHFKSHVTTSTAGSTRRPLSIEACRWTRRVTRSRHSRVPFPPWKDK